jgi:protocatechuate 3,4-dioxygenase, beta subunit
MRLTTVALLLWFAAAAHGQDAYWLRMWEGAQRERPRALNTAGRMAPANEPGTPLVVHGRIYQPDGKTPAPGLIVFAYQTDNTGVYHPQGAPGYRLKGWARTDKDGRFELHTIRPASYPSGRTAAHIHITIEGPKLPRRWTPDVLFAGDPFLSDQEKRDSAARGAFGSIRPVTVRNGTQHVDFNIRIADQGLF